MDEVKLNSDSEDSVEFEDDNEEQLYEEQTDEQKSAFKNLEFDEMVIESDDEDTNDQILNLAGQNLTTIPEDFVQNSGAQYRTLILTNNRIESLANLKHLQRLETIQLDRNELQTLEGMPKMPYLTTLWLNNNNISDLGQLLRVLSKNCPRLQYLSLLRNPICPSVYFKHGNEAKYRRFRYTVLYQLHGLTFLDTTEVTSEEKTQALEKGKYLVVKKPGKSQMKELEETVEDEEVEVKPEENRHEPAAFIGKGRIKYDGRESEGNRFIRNEEL